MKVQSKNMAASTFHAAQIPNFQNLCSLHIMEKETEQKTKDAY